MRKIVVLEDDAVIRSYLCRIIEESFCDIQIFQASNIIEAYTVAMEQHIHLFLIDIILKPSNPGDISGLRFVQEIRGVKRYEYIPVVFITSLQDPKLFSYSQLKCFDFIEKPFDENRVINTIRKALNVPIAEEQERYVYFRKDGITYSININDIYYIDISRRCLTVHCENNILEIPYKTCREILKELGSSMFVQCSRYNIINKRYIEHIDYTRRYIKLKNIKEPIEIGPVLKKKFRNEMRE